jgi:hypothetical protein
MVIVYPLEPAMLTIVSLSSPNLTIPTGLMDLHTTVNQTSDTQLPRLRALTLANARQPLPKHVPLPWRSPTLRPRSEMTLIR